FTYLSIHLSNSSPATNLIFTLSLHDALPIYLFHPIRKPFFTDLSVVSSVTSSPSTAPKTRHSLCIFAICFGGKLTTATTCFPTRSEEHTSELQSRENLVCRLLLEKKKTLLYC